VVMSDEEREITGRRSNHLDYHQAKVVGWRAASRWDRPGRVYFAL
jgi:hypothetical protein